MTLIQGTYIISGGKYPMCPGPVQGTGQSKSQIVITDDIKFRWDVLHPLNYPGDTYHSDWFTIEEYDEDHAYAKPHESHGEKVYIDRQPQLYEIVDVGGLYKIYLPGRKQCLKWNGEDKAVTVAGDSKTDNSLKWSFVNANGPYETYGQFFYQDTRPNSKEIKVFPHFGLLPLDKDLDDRWTKFWGQITDLNTNAKGSAIYKVIFLGRHGESLSNLLAKLERTEDQQDVDDFLNNVDLRDPDLTQRGSLDAMNVHTVWEKETKAKIGLPQISYCSPLYRALLTNTITFGTEVYYDSDKAPELTTIIVENCRERCSHSESEHRRDASTIHKIFPKFGFEDGFAPDDPFWKNGQGKKETMKEVRARARDVLGKVFSTKGTFVSITAHSGFTEAFLRVVERGPYSVPNGTVIPMVCKYTPAKK